MVHSQASLGALSYNPFHITLLPELSASSDGDDEKSGDAKAAEVDKKEEGKEEAGDDKDAKDKPEGAAEKKEDPSKAAESADGDKKEKKEGGDAEGGDKPKDEGVDKEKEKDGDKKGEDLSKPKIETKQTKTLTKTKVCSKPEARIMAHVMTKLRTANPDLVDRVPLCSYPDDHQGKNSEDDEGDSEPKTDDIEKKKLDKAADKAQEQKEIENQMKLLNAKENQEKEDRQTQISDELQKERA